jgi:hypothetical protein
MSPSLESFDAERADFELVLAAIGKVQAASDAALRDLDWIHEWVCSVGLAPLFPAEEIYAEPTLHRLRSPRRREAPNGGGSSQSRGAAG